MQNLRDNVERHEAMTSVAPGVAHIGKGARSEGKAEPRQVGQRLVMEGLNSECHPGFNAPSGENVRIGFWLGRLDETLRHIHDSSLAFAIMS
jgi:hypothetical protein